KKLGEFCEFNNGINAKKEQYGLGRKFINVLDILNNNFITYENIIGKVFVPENVEKNNKVEFGDLVFLRSSETREDVGLCNVYLDKNYALYGGFIIRGKKVSDYNPIFLKEALNIPKKRYEIGSAAGGSTRFNVSQDILRKINVKFPPIEEQQKIGDLFSKLDRQIELEEQKLELLQQQKKGYMQKIFSQELRFKDENGEDYLEWEEKQLGELGVTYAGLSGKAKEDFGFGKDVYVSYVNVFKNNIATLEMVENVSIKPGEKQNNVKFGDILFTTSSEVPHEVGMSSVWLYEKDNVYLNSFCFGFRTTVSFINPIFLARYLRSFEMRKLITILAQGSTRFNISKKELMKLIVKIPRLDEQNRIINLFSILDGGIELQSMKVRKLKKRKQGLLQKMFI
ncbi:TPA: restriction endonuclease subunit S, partial [Staphylococcus aureus]